MSVVEKIIEIDFNDENDIFDKNLFNYGFLGVVKKMIKGWVDVMKDENDMFFINVNYSEYD